MSLVSVPLPSLWTGSHIDMYVCTGGDTKTQSHYGDLPHQINRCQTPHPPLGELYPKKRVGGTNSNQLLYEFGKQVKRKTYENPPVKGCANKKASILCT